MKVIEVVRSIQGEGALHFCSPAIFVRFAGCSKKCEICDTKYAWEGGRSYSPEDLATEVLEWLPLAGDSESEGLLVLTGGEPLEQTATEVAEFIRLIRENFVVKVHLETGCFDEKKLLWLLLHSVVVDGYLDSVCISFKQGVDDFSEYLKFLDLVLGKWLRSVSLELKFVITDSRSFDLERIKRFIFVAEVKSISFQLDCEKVMLGSPDEALAYTKSFGNFTCGMLERFGVSWVFKAEKVSVLPQLHKLVRLP